MITFTSVDVQNTSYEQISARVEFNPGEEFSPIVREDLQNNISLFKNQNNMIQIKIGLLLIQI